MISNPFSAEAYLQGMPQLWQPIGSLIAAAFMALITGSIVRDPELEAAERELGITPQFMR